MRFANALRRATTLVALGSLLVCALITALWIRSYWRCDTFEVNVRWYVSWTQSCHGKISYVYLDRRGAGRGFGPARPGFRSEPTERVLLWQDGNWRVAREGNSFLGFLYVRSESNFVVAEIPYWAIAVASALLPLWWFQNPLRRRRVERGHCPECGYDLRAGHERCPECGHELPRPLEPAIRFVK